MRYTVNLSGGALQDLLEFGVYIAEQDGLATAEAVLLEIEKVWLSLADFPDRGVRVREVAELRKREYREVFFKPYRIVYRVTDDRVLVVLIADGRRNMQALLRRRLTQP